MTLRTRFAPITFCLTLASLACSSQAPEWNGALASPAPAYDEDYAGSDGRIDGEPTEASPYGVDNAGAEALDLQQDADWEAPAAAAPRERGAPTAKREADRMARSPASQAPSPSKSRPSAEAAGQQPWATPTDDANLTPPVVGDAAPWTAEVQSSRAAEMPTWHDGLRHETRPDEYRSTSPSQPFLDPHRAPYSTFSTDVDTASYTLARSRIDHGNWPEPNLVRVEEFLNYFDYDPVPTTYDGPIAVHTEVGPCPWQPRHRLVRVNVAAKSAHRQASMPRNFVFLLDVSGSMNSHDKLPLLRRGLLSLTQTLNAGDTISIVAYAGASGVVLPPTSGNRRGTIRRALRNLDAGGSTNGAAGIELAYQLARRNFVPGGVNRVILATDGDFNVGVSDPQQLERIIERERESGVFLTVLGFGQSGMRDDTMESLADHGNGNYAFIDNADEAHRVLVQEGAATLHTAAKDVKLQVEFNPDVVAAYRLVGYDNRRLADRDFNDDRKDAGDLGDGDTVTALYELVLNQAASPTIDQPRYGDRFPHGGGVVRPVASPGAELMHVKLRYKEPHQTSSRRFDHVAFDDGRDWLQVSADYQFAAAVAGFALRLRGDQDIAHWHLQSIASLAETAIAQTSGRDRRREREAFVAVVRKAEQLDYRY